MPPQANGGAASHDMGIKKMNTLEFYLEDAYQRECDARILAVDARGIQLDRTPFYALGGGQPGDRGAIDTEFGAIEIVNTIRDREAGEIIHVPAEGVDVSRLQPGAEVTARIDWELRHRHMRCHTCLHLLCSLIPFPVTGGSVRADSGRLDFDIPEPILDKAELSERLQALIDQNRAVRFQFLTPTQVRAKPELVRTLQVAPPMGDAPVRLVEIDGVDLQACGGSHLRATGEIKRAWVTRIEKKGKQNRRVEIAIAAD
jgi:misacylated tRNA(Ala) deacylase